MLTFSLKAVVKWFALYAAPFYIRKCQMMLGYRKIMSAVMLKNVRLSYGNVNTYVLRTRYGISIVFRSVQKLTNCLSNIEIHNCASHVNTCHYLDFNKTHNEFPQFYTAIWANYTNRHAVCKREKPKQFV